MEIEVTKEKENPLLERKELMIRVSYEGTTPERSEVIKKVASINNTTPEMVVIQNLEGSFGKRESTGYVKIYNSIDRLNKVELKHIIKRANKEEDT